MPVTTAVASCYYVGWLGEQVLAPTLGVLAMKIVTWTRDIGVTFVVLFANGTSCAEYVALNPTTKRPFYEGWNKRQATSAGEKFKASKGDNWEKGNLNYTKFNPSTGEEETLFRHRNLGN